MDLAATSKLPEPLSLDGSIYQNWVKFRREFDDYLTSIEFDEKPDKIKTAKLRNLIGDEGRQIIVELQLEHSADYNDLINKLEDWVKSERNPIRRRLKFFNRVQKDDETFEDFLRDMRRLIRVCNFGDFSEELLRDRIVSGILDSQLKELFCATPDITLESVVQMCRVAELSEEQLLRLLSLKRRHEDADVAAVKIAKSSSVTNFKMEAISGSTKEASIQTDDNEEQPETILRATLRNVSELTEFPVESPPRYVHNLPWKILVQQNEEKKTKRFGFFLECNAQSTNTSWSCFATMEFKILPQKEGVEPVTQKWKFLFNSKDINQGYGSYMNWTDLLDPNEGYIKDDSIILEVIFKAEEPKGLEDVKGAHFKLH